MMNKTFILALASLAPFAVADEVKLKDGTVYKNCTVDVETPETVTILVPVSGGIKDSISLKREQIESIAKASPDEVAAAKINKTYAKPESMDVKALEAAVVDLDGTIKKNPQGQAHDAAVKARAQVVVLLEEKKQETEDKAAQTAREEEAVTARTRYDHESGKLLKRFKAFSAAAKPYQAMAVYDRLKEKYPASSALAEAYPDAVRTVGQVKRKLDVMIAAKEKALEKERLAMSAESERRRAENNKLPPEQQQARLEAFHKKQVAMQERENQLTEVHRAHYKKVQKRGDRWFEPTAGSLEAMRDLKRVVDTDAERLKDQEKEEGAGSAALEKTWSLCDEKKFDEAMESLAEVRSAGVPKEYYEELSETVGAGFQEQRARERDERAAAARKMREQRDKESKEKRDAGSRKK